MLRKFYWGFCYCIVLFINFINFNIFRSFVVIYFVFEIIMIMEEGKMF